jgi:hypothetical protein
MQKKITDLKKGQKFLYRAFGSVTVSEGTFGGASPNGQFAKVGEAAWLPVDSVEVVDVLAAAK